MTARLGPLAVATPPPIEQGVLWEECFSRAYRDVRGGRHVWRSAGVATRHAAVDPRELDVSRWSTGARMERYVQEARPLAVRAVQGALDAAGTVAAEVDLLTVVSCTGYATPGLDLAVARELGMSRGLQRLVVGHMGCHAALPALRPVADAAVAGGATSVLLCVELPSLHVQPPGADLEQLVVHALFSDAAVAAVVRPGGDEPGLDVVEIAALTDADHETAMTWAITDLGFRMTLSAEVPHVLSRHVRCFVDGLLARHQLDRAGVAGWAVHPGGPRIVDVCASALELDDDAVAASRRTLRDHGNCSSATVMLVLDDLLAARPLADGDHVVALAFGPGLTLYAALLRWSSGGAPCGGAGPTPAAPAHVSSWPARP